MSAISGFRPQQIVAVRLVEISCQRGIVAGLLLLLSLVVTSMADQSWNKRGEKCPWGSSEALPYVYRLIGPSISPLPRIVISFHLKLCK